MWGAGEHRSCALQEQGGHTGSRSFSEADARCCYSPCADECCPGMSLSRHDTGDALYPTSPADSQPLVGLEILHMISCICLAHEHTCLTAWLAIYPELAVHMSADHILYRQGRRHSSEKAQAELPEPCPHLQHSAVCLSPLAALCQVFR